MKTNLFDMAMEGVNEIIEELSNSFAGEFKNTNPFDKEKMPEEEQVYQFETEGENTFRQLADSQGLDTAITWLDKMKKLQEKFNGK